MDVYPVALGKTGKVSEKNHHLYMGGLTSELANRGYRPRRVRNNLFSHNPPPPTQTNPPQQSHPFKGLTPLLKGGKEKHEWEKGGQEDFGL